jgi:hypothetical protein
LDDVPYGEEEMALLEEKVLLVLEGVLHGWMKSISG